MTRIGSKAGALLLEAVAEAEAEASAPGTISATTMKSGLKLEAKPLRD